MTAVPKRPTGLRTQLMVGLSLIILVSTMSTGAITMWTTRQQAVDMDLDSGKSLGTSLAAVLAGALGHRQDASEALQRAISSVSTSPAVQSVVVVNRSGLPLVSSSDRPGGEPQAADLAAAINTGQQVVRAAPGEPRTLAVSTPIIARGDLVGGVRLELLLGPDRSGWPMLFWILMALDGGAMVLFVGLVLTTYVVRPVEAMQRAAARVTRGDLEVTLPVTGAYELSSLARSFNVMTASLKDHLQRLERQQRELAQNREVLIRSEKLASVGRLAAGVAHEVGNPLQSVVGFTEILLGEELTPGERRDLLQRVGGEAQRIHRIVRELLDYARPVEDAPEAVDLAAVVAQTLQLVGPQARLRGVTVETHALEELPRVAATTRRLVQVMVNLVLNAADAMEGKGRIVIHGQADAPEPGRVVLRIANSGPLISPEDRQRIFDPFFTTKAPGQGTGLGLSVALSIAQGYGGDLTLDPRADLTTFVLNLPAAQETTGDPEG